MARTMTAVEVLRALRKRYLLPEWVFAAEVNVGRRRADAIALNTFPSRGFEVHGFEIKCNRGDLLKELKDPQKADEVAAFCDRWWMVVGDRSIVDPGEIPLTWGLMWPHGKSVIVKKQAEPLRNDAATRWDIGFFSLFARRALLQDDGEKPFQAQLDAAMDEGIRQGKKVHESRMNYLQEELERTKANLATFEETSGIKITRWDGQGQHRRMGEAVKVLMQRGVSDRHINRLDREADELEKLAKELREGAGILREFEVEMEGVA